MWCAKSILRLYTFPHALHLKLPGICSACVTVAVWRVLLHNDPVNSMEYVVTTLREVVPQLSEQDAMAVMLEAHNTGVGLVIVCDIEPAEFYCETLKSKGLTSTIEPES